jgi:uncharacterized protein YdbL (DUF1318 family)
MKNLLLTLFTSFLLFTTSAWALDLTAAKNTGLVGETPSGYLAAVKSPDDATKKLVKDINGKRKAHYKKIAKGNSTSIQVVESLAGETAISKTAKGNFIRVNGKWKVK